jgi:hypothetical protein
VNRTLVGLLAAAFAASSCSLVLVEPLKVNRGEQEGRCSEVYFVPVADMLVAGYAGLRAATPSGARRPEIPLGVMSHDEDLLLSTSVAVVAAVSSIYGFSKVSECRSFRSAQ